MPLYAPPTSEAAPNAALDAEYVNEGDHTKTVHDALDIDAATVETRSSAYLLARGNHTGTQAIATLSDHSKANHDSLSIDAATVNGASAAAIRARSSHTGTQSISTLSDHSKANHDSLSIDAGTVNGASAADIRARSSHTGTQSVSTLSDHTRSVHIALGLATGIYKNVKDYLAVGDGSTDDTQALVDANAAAGTGDVVLVPAGTFLTTVPVVAKAGVHYLGLHRNYSIIKLANGANADAVMASAAWLGTSATSADAPLIIEHLKLDGNKANQTSGLGHGLALLSFWDDLQNVEVLNPLGTGILHSATRRDGTEISGTSVEHMMKRVVVRNPGGYGIRASDPTPSVQTVTDGWILGAIIQNAVEDSIRIESGAGWFVGAGTHIYGAQKSGIQIGRSASARVIGNYIETWGSSSTAASYFGIGFGDGSTMYATGPQPGVIANNTMNFTGGANAGSSIRGIFVGASGSGTTNVEVGGNGVYGGGAGVGVGMRFTNQDSTATLNVTLGPNNVLGWPARSEMTINPNSGILNLLRDINALSRAYKRHSYR